MLKVSPADPAWSHLVELQWQLVSDAADMPSNVRSALWGRRERELVARANRIPTLAPWPSLPKPVAAIYNMPQNRARVARILDFVGSGERIVDVGCGNGSLSGRVLLSRDPSQYVGIEPSTDSVRGFHEMAELNGVAAGSFRIVESTVQDAGEEAIREVDPSLVMILEVLEHINDPAGVLADVARCVGPETDLLISVPLIGRIEHEWGHVSVFDRSRLEDMAARAGLVIHWVEAVMGEWLHLVLSKSADERPRLRAVLSEGRQEPAEPTPDADYYFRRLDLSSSSVIAASASADPSLEVRHGDKDLRIEVPAGSAEVACGFTIYRPAMSVVRVEVEVEGVAPASGFAHFSDQGQVLERWQLTERELTSLASGGRTLAFRRGFDTGREHTNLRSSFDAERFDLVVRGASSTGWSMTVRNAAYVKAIDNLTQPRSPGFLLKVG